MSNKQIIFTALVALAVMYVVKHVDFLNKLVG